MKFFRRAAHYTSMIAPMILAMSAFLSAQSQPQPQQAQPNRSHADGVTDGPTTNVSVSVNLPGSTEQPSRPTQTPQNQTTNTGATWAQVVIGIIADVLTFVLAVCTIALAGISAYQGWMARQTFIAVHRPKITIRNVVIPMASEMLGIDDFHSAYKASMEMSLDLHNLNGSFHVINIGDTSATVTSIETLIFLGERLPLRRPYDTGIHPPQIAVPLAPGKSHKFDFPVRPFSEDESAKQINLGKTNVYGMGLITYRDERGTPRQTGFCQRLDRETRRFVPVDDPDYQYSD